MITTLIITMPQDELGDHGAFSEQDQPEEKTCKRCLEVESECQCAYYDALEKEELEQVRIDSMKTRPSDIFKTLFQAQTIFNII